MSNLLWILVIYFLNLITVVISSSGDRSKFYVLCVDRCSLKDCKIGGEFKRYPPFDLQLLYWSCKDNCSYGCMWETVTHFTTRGLDVPQFHGKWPFIRAFGLQEPASVLFSLLNFYAHVRMYNTFRKNVHPSNPMFYVWTYFMIVCTHGWIWSAVFHARDKYFTEVMDYSCAFTTVLTLLYCLLLR
ncbi:post-GPI attachment to proteins factor 3-like isoform X1 [Belonocnema kinseyi]|uniref:post-GPI attachment to proteins factor 3-like isoform X1 n=1 Tax=Belonocnema kinseyi TaxID=2817044 RepID=UPI00143D760D|nr:post-GPI attachment to proteins factor 3-like isoform X1 [Belonocnema kinseyi]